MSRDEISPLVDPFPRLHNTPGYREASRNALVQPKANDPHFPPTSPPFLYLFSSHSLSTPILFPPFPFPFAPLHPTPIPPSLCSSSLFIFPSPIPFPPFFPPLRIFLTKPLSTNFLSHFSLTTLPPSPCPYLSPLSLILTSLPQRSILPSLNNPFPHLPLTIPSFSPPHLFPSSCHTSPHTFSFTARPHTLHSTHPHFRVVSSSGDPLKHVNGTIRTCSLLNHALRNAGARRFHSRRWKLVNELLYV